MASKTSRGTRPAAAAPAVDTKATSVITIAAELCKAQGGKARVADLALGMTRQAIEQRWPRGERS